MTSLLYCINNQHDFKGWSENQRIVSHDKTLIFDLDSPVDKWLSGACFQAPAEDISVCLVLEHPARYGVQWTLSTDDALHKSTN